MWRRREETGVTEATEFTTEKRRNGDQRKDHSRSAAPRCARRWRSPDVQIQARVICSCEGLYLNLG
jgi:hypothetical protein